MVLGKEKESKLMEQKEEIRKKYTYMDIQLQQSAIEPWGKMNVISINDTVTIGYPHWKKGIK